MINVRTSLHAQTRVRQRGYRQDDLTTVLEYGTPVQDGSVLTNRDVQQQVRKLKSQIASLERLSGTRIVCRDDTVITAFRPNRRQMKNLLSKGRDHG